MPCGVQLDDLVSLSKTDRLGRVRTLHPQTPTEVWQEEPHGDMLQVVAPIALVRRAFLTSAHEQVVLVHSSFHHQRIKLHKTTIMSTIPLHPAVTRVHVSESSFANSGQLVIDMTEKSAYADFSSTPYTPHTPYNLHREPSLHETNRSQLWDRGQDLKKLPFVTTSPHLHECMAEFLGAVIVIGFGLAVNSQVAISEGKAGDVMTVSLAWGVAVLMGVYTAENVSGAHIISVISFTHAVYGRMPWWKVPGYMFAQTLGAFVAAALVYVLHYEKISTGDLETMHFLFVTYPHDGSNYTAFYTEVLQCAFLMSCAYAITDQRNRCPGPVGTPFALALLVMALGAAFSLNTGLGASVNRDLGPRLFAYLAGYKAAFTEYSYYFWIPIVGPFLGGVIGSGAYILLVEIQNPFVIPDHHTAS